MTFEKLVAEIELPSGFWAQAVRDPFREHLLRISICREAEPITICAADLLVWDSENAAKLKNAVASRLETLQDKI